MFTQHSQERSASRSSTFLILYGTTRRHIPQENSGHIHGYENIKSKTQKPSGPLLDIHNRAREIFAIRQELKVANIHGVHCAGLSDFSVRGAARQQFFFGKWRSSFAGSSDGKMNVQSACALNTR
jgi:hypothetical protein